MRFLALDFETGGLDPKKNAPASLGVALFENGEPMSTREWKIRPVGTPGNTKKVYEPKALEVNGLTMEDLWAAPEARTVVRELGEWACEHGMNDGLVVAYNAPFDYQFYSDLMFMAGGYAKAFGRFMATKPPLTGPWQCARMLAVERLELPNYKLDSAVAHFGMSRKGQYHGALEDAVLAGYVYHALTQGALSHA